MPDVPRSLAELTPPWLSGAIARRCPGAIVSGIELGPVADGTNRRATVRLQYASGNGPEAVFVKAPGRLLHRLALLALGAWQTEAQLAAADPELPLEHPLPYAAAIDRRRLAAVVVTDDITTRGGTPNDGIRPLSVTAVRDGLAGLARMHAAYWDRPLPEPLQFVQPWRLSARYAPISAASLANARRRLSRLGEAGLLPARATVALLERQFRHSARLAASGPQTLLHGDPHPGNTYSLPGDRTGFYDWQLVRTGSWSHDVGYFLVGSLDVDDRRRHEDELLAGYLETLHEAGVSVPAADATSRYRASPAYGLGTWLHTLSAGSFQPADVCLATLRRFAAAYDDLGTVHWTTSD